MDIMLPQVRSGWITAEETWTYAGADSPSFTFTIAGDKRDKYSAGMKIKLTQGSVKYFIITAVSYSGGNTTITVTGGSDYSLASATITEPYFSKAETPQGFPQWFTWTPTLSANGDMTWTSANIEFAGFRIIGSWLTGKVRIRGTTGGVANTQLRFTFPVAKNSSYPNNSTVGSGCVEDGTIVGSITISSSVYLACYKYNYSSFSIGPNKYVIGEFSYPI